jgi:hypothetical protein
MKTLLVLLVAMILFVVTIRAQINEDLQGNYELTGELSPILLNQDELGNLTAVCVESCGFEGINNATYNVTVTESEFIVVIESTTSESNCATPDIVFELTNANSVGENIIGTGSLTISGTNTIDLGDRCVLFDGVNLVFDLLNDACLSNYDQSSQCIHGDDSVVADSYILSTNSTGVLLPEGTIAESSVAAESTTTEPRESSDAVRVMWQMLAILPVVMIVLF